MNDDPVNAPTAGDLWLHDYWPSEYEPVYAFYPIEPFRTWYYIVCDILRLFLFIHMTVNNLKTFIILLFLFKFSFELSILTTLSFQQD